MKYNYKAGVEREKKRLKTWAVLPLFAVVISGYYTVNMLSPAIRTPLDASPDAVAQKLTTSPPDSHENRLYIPKINVDISIISGNYAAAAGNGAWHATPEDGDPINGGDFVLAASRFEMGATPKETRAMSAFYHIDKLETNDQLYIDYEGTRYAYSVIAIHSSTQEIQPSTEGENETRVLLYTVDGNGEKDGGEIIEAEPIGTIAWINGVARLTTIN